MKLAVKNTSQHAGFTLLELSIALAIIALVTAMGMSAGKEMLESSRKAQTEQKLNQIEKSLQQYSEVNRRLPCPADVTLSETNANFGLEALNKGSCTGGTPAANFLDATNQSAEGTVPVKTLGLANEFMVDGWGRRIAYVVSKKNTEANAFSYYNYTDSACAKIIVKDAAAGNRTQHAAYVLISFGLDGHGAYLPNGTRLNSGNTNASSQTNSHYSALGVPLAYSASFIQKDPTEDPASKVNRFDDIVRFKERWQMQTREDAINLDAGPCTYGTRFNGEYAWQYSGFSIASGDINGDGLTDIIIGGTDYVYVVFGKPAGLDASNDLNNGGASINGTSGFRITTAASSTYFGFLVGAGDINGDGYDDILIGAHTAANNGSNSGSVYVVFGKAGSWSATQEVSTLMDGTHGFRLDGEAVNTYLSGGGYQTTRLLAGDINYDGIKDLIIGAPKIDIGGQLGAVYVVFGRTNGWPSTQTLNTTWLGNGGATAVNGFRLKPASAYQPYFGDSIGAADINNDGKTDLVIGCYDGCSAGGAGHVYAVFGASTASWTNDQTLNNSFFTGGSGTSGVRGVDFAGGSAWPAPDYLGSSIATGDFNGDGISDFMAGAMSKSPTGGAYVVYGKASGTWQASQALTSNYLGNGTANAVNGFYLQGENVATVAYVGMIATAGDLNGDGITDMIISAPYSGPTFWEGVVYVVYGSTTGWLTSQTLDSTFLTGGSGAIGVKGFEVRGTCSICRLAGLASGHFTNDKYDDLYLGMPSDNGAPGVYAGTSYILYGGPNLATLGISQAINTLIP